MSPIREGFDVAVHDGEKAFGAVRHVSKDEITVYVEAAGDFRIPLSAVKDVEDAKAVQWVSFIPPTAKVKSAMKATFNADGELVAGEDKAPSAGAFQATVDGLKGYTRGRVLPGLLQQSALQSA